MDIWNWIGSQEKRENEPIGGVFRLLMYLFSSFLPFFSPAIFVNSPFFVILVLYCFALRNQASGGL